MYVCMYVCMYVYIYIHVLLDFPASSDILRFRFSRCEDHDAQGVVGRLIYYMI